MKDRNNQITKFLLPAVLSMIAGAVDVTGFLALGGLFTAHITGNLVVLAAHYITGGFSEVGPLLSVPVFIVVLGAVTAGCASRHPALPILPEVSHGGGPGGPAGGPGRVPAADLRPRGRGAY